MFFGAAVYIQRIFWIHEHGKVSLIFVFMNLFSGPPHHTRHIQASRAFGIVRCSKRDILCTYLGNRWLRLHLIGLTISTLWRCTAARMKSILLDCVGPGHSTDSGLASGTRPYSFGGPVKHRGIFKPLGIFLLW